MVDLFQTGMAWKPGIPHPSIVALIPARFGSKRIPSKNVQRLGGHPLMAYSIAVAHASGIFGQVVVSSDAEAYREIATAYGAEFRLRPEVIAQDDSPDILWVKDSLSYLSSSAEAFVSYDAFAILRPTSPFRSPGMIAQAWGRFLEQQPADSLRAVEMAKQHPGKMWTVNGTRMQPLLPFHGLVAPWHSMPTQSLPLVLVQNASLEIAWTKTVTELGSISGVSVVPYMTAGIEGFDINDFEDWQRAASMADRLPKLAGKESE